MLQCRGSAFLIPLIEVRTKAFRSEQKEQKIQEFEKQLLDFLLFLCIYSMYTDCWIIYKPNNQSFLTLNKKNKKIYGIFTYFFKYMETK